MEIEYLYKNFYFRGLLVKSNVSNLNQHTDPSCSFNDDYELLSCRILKILQQNEGKILLDTFFSHMSDLPRTIVEEQISTMILEGLVYTNLGMIFQV